VTKRKEPTDSVYVVYLEKTVTVGAGVTVKVRARKESTKKKFIKNSAVNIAEMVKDKYWVDLCESDEARVSDIVPEQFSDRAYNTCPHCKGILDDDDVIDLGEVED
jgi:hypothetical protein